MENKLGFHVQKLLQQDPATIPTDEKVVAYLMETYREYQRKPQNVLHKLVSKILTKHRADKSNQDNDDQLDSLR